MSRGMANILEIWSRTLGVWSLRCSCHDAKQPPGTQTSLQRERDLNYIIAQS